MDPNSIQPFGYAKRSENEYKTVTSLKVRNCFFKSRERKKKKKKYPLCLYFMAHFHPGIL